MCRLIAWRGYNAVGQYEQYEQHNQEGQHGQLRGEGSGGLGRAREGERFQRQTFVHPLTLVSSLGGAGIASVKLRGLLLCETHAKPHTRPPYCNEFYSD